MYSVFESLKKISAKMHFSENMSEIKEKLGPKKNKFQSCFCSTYDELNPA